jgi:serine/threonine protein kinase
MLEGHFDTSNRIISRFNYCDVRIQDGFVVKAYDPKVRKEDYHHEHYMNEQIAALKSNLFIVCANYCDTKFSLWFPLNPWPTLEEVDVAKLEFRAEIWSGLLSALQMLHQIRICHNDLHPGNVIVLNIPPYVKLIDFGESNEFNFPVDFSPWIYRNPSMPVCKTHPLNDFWGLAILYFILQPALSGSIFNISNENKRSLHYHTLAELLLMYPKIDFAAEMLQALHGDFTPLVSKFWNFEL